MINISLILTGIKLWNYQEFSNYNIASTKTTSDQYAKIDHNLKAKTAGKVIAFAPREDQED